MNAHTHTDPDDADLSTLAVWLAGFRAGQGKPEGPGKWRDPDFCDGFRAAREARDAREAR